MKFRSFWAAADHHKYIESEDFVETAVAAECLLSRDDAAKDADRINALIRIVSAVYNELPKKAQTDIAGLFGYEEIKGED